MKERPILMTPENAQKCFDGVKTQTRRIVKPQPEEGMKILGPEMYTPCRTDKNGEMYPGEDVFGVYSDDGEWGVACPYGAPGDRLWIREAGWFKQWPGGNTIKAYKANWDGHDGTPWGDIEPKKWMPSLHMPRWACRTVVEITEIRVQRIQEISHDDAIAEGLSYEITTDVPCSNFRDLWISINGPDSWDANPWVWALTFKKVTV